MSFQMVSRHHRPLLIGFLALLLTGDRLGQLAAQTNVDNSELSERDRLWRDARKLSDKGQVREAAALGEKVLSLNRQQFGSTASESVETLDWLAFQYQLAGQLDEAVGRASELLRIHRDRDRNSWQSTTARWRVDYLQKLSQVDEAKLQKMLELEKQSNVLFAAGRNGEALERMKELFPFEIGVLGAEHPFLANSYSSQATLMISLGQFQAAEEQSAKALRIRRQQLGEKHPETATAAWTLARSRLRQSKDAQALKPLALARDAWKAAGNRENAAWMDSRRGESLAMLGCLDEAKNALNASLSAFQEIGHTAGEMQLLENLDAVALMASDWDLAEECRKKLLTLKVKQLGKDHWQVKDAQLALIDLVRRRQHTEKERKLLAAAVDLNQRIIQMVRAGRAKEVRSLAEQLLELHRRLLGEEHPDTATSMDNLGALLKSLREYEAAEKHHARAREIRKAVLGEHHPTYATSLNNLADLYLSTGRVKESLVHYRQAKDLKREVIGEDQPEYALSLNNLASALQTTGAYVESEQYFRNAAEIYRTTRGETSREYAIALSNLASLLDDRGSFREAETLHLQSLTIRRGLSQSPSPSLATGLNNLAAHFGETARYKKAEQHYREALGVRRQIHGEEHPEYAQCLSNLALVYQHQGKLSKAVDLFARAREILESTLDAGDPQLATILNNQAELYRELSDFTKARDCIEKSQAILKRAFGDEHPAFARSLHNLASLLADQGDYARAEPLYQQARNLYRKRLGEQHPDYVNTVNSLGSLYENLGDLPRAELFYIEARDVRRKVLGADHPDYATSLNNLASVYHSLKQYRKAEALLLQAKRVFQSLGDTHPDLALSLNNLASLYDDMNRLDESGRLYQQSMQIRRKVYGEGHPEFALSLNNLAFWHFRKGDNIRATELFSRALSIYREALGDGHPTTVWTINSLAEMRRASGDLKEAESLSFDSLNRTRQQIENASLVLSERQQLALGELFRNQLDGYLSLALESGEFSDKAAREVLNWKGATLIRQRSIRRAVEEFTPEQESKFRELQKLMRRILAFPAASPFGEPADRRRRLADLVEKKEQLEAELGRVARTLFDASPKLTLEEFQRALPPGSVLIDFLEFVRTGPAREGERNSTRSLLVTVLPKRGPPRLIDLGAIAPLRDAIQRWRETFGVSDGGQQAGALLRRRIWEPVVRAIPALQPTGDDQAPKQNPLVVVSTDGFLSRLPLGALPGRRQGTWLIEDHRLAFVSVPRLVPDVLSREVKSRTWRHLLLVGDVDYGLNATGQSRPWVRLPGTAREVAGIQRLYRDVIPANGSIQLLRGRAATEARIQELIRHSDIVHFATHGLFELHEIPADPLRVLASRGMSDWCSGWLDAIRSFREKPASTVARSAIVLADANRPSGSVQPPSHGKIDADGLLMAEELLAIPLHRTDLVVLSACDTGQGKAAAAEGLLGIQRAFEVAGARTTVASLWKVDDLATQVLMERFHQNLQNPGTTRLDALRNAQLELLRYGRKGLRDAARAASDAGEGNRGATLMLDVLKALPDERLPPFYWAAFVLSGDWR